MNQSLFWRAELPVVVFDGLRTALPADLEAGGSGSVKARGSPSSRFEVPVGQAPFGAPEAPVPAGE